MKLTPKDTYFDLIETSITHSILPELSSDSAQEKAHQILSVLRVLRNRDHNAGANVQESIAQAITLSEKLTALLSKHKIALPPPPNLSSDHDILSLLSNHVLLTQSIDELSKSVGSNLSEIDPKHALSLLRAASEWELATLSLESAAYAANTSSTVTEPTLDMAEQPLTAEVLEKHMKSAGHMLDDESISMFSRITGGYGKLTFMFEVTTANGETQEFVARMEDAYPMFEFRTFELKREFELVKTLHRQGYSAPNALWFGEGVSGTAGNFYVMEKLPGKMAGTFLEGASTLPESFLTEWAQAIAQLHSYPVSKFKEVINDFEDPVLLNGSRKDAYLWQITEWETYLRSQPHLPSPYLTFMLAWLRENIPNSNLPTSLIHGDIYIHNVLAHEGRISAVLDWETAMFGAPEQDLAYIQPNVVKHMDWDKFLSIYHEAGGPEIDEASFSFYNAFNAFRISVGGNRAIYNLQNGHYSDIRFTMVELGFVPAFFQMGLASTAS